jgi:hypothetical protein
MDIFSLLGAARIASVPENVHHRSKVSSAIRDRDGGSVSYAGWRSALSGRHWVHGMKDRYSQMTR